MKTKQTAVEQLISKIPLGIRMQLAELGVDFEQAKEIEKERMIEFAFNALKIADDTMNGYIDVDKLYNETYGGNK